MINGMAKAHFPSANIQMVFDMDDRKNRFVAIFLTPRPRLHGSVKTQNIDKPEPEASLDVRQTIGGQSG